ncbi:MAG: TatD family hydrolase [Candidatus Hadarchaeum sp.]|uniref:TatD family hydrolase n=1 Tax=Candidatus Hadarchaeum sp. TaxID=2883567 RepID=UPI003D0FE5AF
MSFIDSHTHIYLRGAQDLEAMSAAGVEGVVICSYFPVKPTGPTTLIDLHRWLAEGESERLKNYGITAFLAVGIHPRCIPSTGVNQVLEHLASFFESGRAMALGEVGLETASEEEAKVLVKQIELAKSYDLPMIFHTPRQNKSQVFDRLLKLIGSQKVEWSKVIIDHLTLELAARTKTLGANIGITVQPGKMAEKDVISVVNNIGAEDIMVNSDLSNQPSDPLTVPKVARALCEAGLSKGDVEKVTYLNAKMVLNFR